MSKLQWRLAAIVAALVASGWFLFPRDVTVRRRGVDGIMHETVERRVPLQLGLDLRGGMYMALEVDDSKQAIADKSDAIDRALKTVRTRVEGFGVSEPIVQKSGNDRIILQLPGMTEEDRAIAVVRQQAFLEFKITDETQALERALPRLDAIVKERRLVAATGAAAPTTPAAPRGLQGLLTDTGTKADTGRARRDSAKADTVVTGGGAFSNLLQQGGINGEYMVKASDVRTL